MNYEHMSEYRTLELISTIYHVGRFIHTLHETYQIYTILCLRTCIDTLNWDYFEHFLVLFQFSLHALKDGKKQHCHPEKLDWVYVLLKKESQNDLHVEHTFVEVAA